jgi:drug/metabolite transporter (DMT)-like permease
MLALFDGGLHWLWLTLICAAALASADAATKAWLRGLSAAQLLLVRFSLTGLLLVPLLSALPPLASLPPALWGWLALMLPLEMTAMALYMIAIRDHPLSLTLPYLAFTPVFVLLLAYLLLGETTTWVGALGVLCIVAGAWLLNAAAADGLGWRGWLRPLRAIWWEAGSRLMLVVALIYALTVTFSKAALAYLAPMPFGALYFALLGLLTLGIFAAWEFVAALTRRRARPVARDACNGRADAQQHRRQGWPLVAAIVLVAALNALMILTHFQAIQSANVAYMIAVKRSSLLFGMLYGFLCFREPQMRQRLPAAGLMLLGVFLIASTA